TPAAVTALREAMTDIYWYKSDLRSFLTAALSRPELLARVNWGDYKRNIVGSLVGYMAQHQDQYLDDLLALMYEVARLMDFQLFDLDPKESFRVVGDQIDGAFTFDKTDYLFEGKWQQAPVDVAILDAFNGKISRKLENTLGMFLSINGFTPAAIETHSSKRP